MITAVMQKTSHVMNGCCHLSRRWPMKALAAGNISDTTMAAVTSDVNPGLSQVWFRNSIVTALHNKAMATEKKNQTLWANRVKVP